MSEIITLQLGHYSNFIGTHWWNLQESCFCYDSTSNEIPEIDPRKTFREGRTLRGDSTFTPRALFIDLKGSLKTLKQEGSLYTYRNTKETPILWDGPTQLHDSGIEEKNQFLRDLQAEDDAMLHDEDKDICHNSSIEVKTPTNYDLDEQVETWSDFLRLPLHHKSVFVIKEHQFNANDDSFNVFGYGKDIFNNDNYKDEMEDRIRYFAEDCDSLQGFHLLMDNHDGFSGFGSSLNEYLTEEYPKKTTFVVPSISSNYDSSSEYHILNSLLSFESLVDSCSLFSPVCIYDNVGRRGGNSLKFEGLTYKPELMYHTSSIMAVAFDTVTSSYRCRNAQTSMSDLNIMSMNERKAVSMSLYFPCEQSHFQDDRNKLIDSLTSLTPSTEDFKSKMQWMTLRGSNSALKKLNRKSNSKSGSDLVQDVINEEFHGISPGSETHVSILKDIQKINVPFPKIISSAATSVDREYLKPWSLAGLHSTNDFNLYFSNLAKDAVRAYGNFNSKFQDAGLERDEYIEALHKVKSLSECYMD